MTKKTGIALGAGGANGLAHILMLEVFDELGIRPHRIAGSSIGAVIGALYASGLSAKQIRDLAGDLVVRKTDKWKQVLFEKNIFKWLSFLEPAFGKGGLISGDAILSWLLENIQSTTFEELEIPLAVVATDFWQGGERVFASGELNPAIEGSIAIPGIFSPVRFENALLVDGGLVNPVPYDLLLDDCDITVAIDVTGRRSEKDDLSFVDGMLHSFQIMQQSIMAEKRARREPAIYITADVLDVRALEFYKLDQIFEDSQKAKRELRERLAELL